MSNTEQKQKILLKRTTEVDKQPIPSGASHGELFLNIASGANAHNKIATMQIGTNEAIIWSDDIANEKKFALKTEVEALVKEVEDNELVTATAISTISTSAGFNEDGSSALEGGMSLTEAIIDLQARAGVIEESDPIFAKSAASGITAADITAWNNKMDFVDRVSSAYTSYSAITSTSAKTSASATTSYSAITATSAKTSVSAVSATTSVSAKTSVSATTSTKAIQDGDGNVISSTYASKTELENLIQEVEDSEFVTANALTQFNKSAGFTEGGISNLPDQQSLTDAIIELQGRTSDLEESDPIFNKSVAAGITSEDIENWNNKLDKDGKAASAQTADKVKNSLTVGSKTYNGSNAVTITAADLGLESALKYHGKTKTILTDGATTNPIILSDGTSHSALTGCVVISSGYNGDTKEFFWNGSKWEELGDESSWKPKQTAKTDPSANGSGLTFIDTISQDTNGVITATKKAVNLGNYKPKQTAKTDPTASSSALTFIDTISQDVNGVITATKKAVNLGGYWKKTERVNSATTTSFLEPYESILDASSNDNKNKGYFCYVNPGAGDTNVPRAGVLTSFRDSQGCATQFLSDYKYDDLYYRSAKSDISAIGTTWTDWHKIAYIDSKVNSAITADYAIQDGEGNNIVNTYATKSSIPTSVTVSNWGFTKNAGTVTSVKVQGTNGLTGSGTVTASGTITISGVTATTAATGVSKLVTGDLNGKSYADGMAASQAHTHSQYLTGYTEQYKGTVTGVTAGNGLTGGGSKSTGSTGLTLNVGAGTGISVSTDAVGISSDYQNKIASGVSAYTMVKELIQDIEDNELVISTIVTKINDSCGFNENSESVLPNGQNLTEAIIELQGQLPVTLPTASTSTLGIMKVGNFLTATSGNVSVSTGTSSSTVARGDHGHAASSITSGTFNTARIPTGITVSAAKSASTISAVTGTGKYWLLGHSSSSNGYYGVYKNANVYMENGSLYASSDKTLKTHVENVNGDPELIKRIPKAYFHWNNDEDKKRQMGTYAQDLEEVYPELVTKDKDGIRAVAYDRLGVVALAGIDKLYDMVQELMKKNDELEKRIKELENK